MDQQLIDSAIKQRCEYLKAGTLSVFTGRGHGRLNKMTPVYCIARVHGRASTRRGHG